MGFIHLNKYTAGALIPMSKLCYTSNRLREETGDQSDQTQRVVAATVDALGTYIQARGNKSGTRRNGTISSRVDVNSLYLY